MRITRETLSLRLDHGPFLADEELGRVDLGKLVTRAAVGGHGSVVFTEKQYDAGTRIDADRIAIAVILPAREYAELLNRAYPPGVVADLVIR